MSDGSENEARGLNALGNPEVQTRGGADGGPEGEGRLGQVRPGGVVARGEKRGDFFFEVGQTVVEHIHVLFDALEPAMKLVHRFVVFGDQGQM